MICEGTIRACKCQEHRAYRLRKEMDNRAKLRLAGHKRVRYDRHVSNTSPRLVARELGFGTFASGGRFWTWDLLLEPAVASYWSVRVSDFPTRGVRTDVTSGSGVGFDTGSHE